MITEMFTFDTKSDQTEIIKFQEPFKSHIVMAWSCSQKISDFIQKKITGALSTFFN